jgi:hypothetical protein
VQKEEISCPREMQRGRFSKKCLNRDLGIYEIDGINIGAFRLVGYFTWNEEAAGSNPVSYTK